MPVSPPASAFVAVKAAVGALHVQPAADVEAKQRTHRAVALKIRTFGYLALQHFNLAAAAVVAVNVDKTLEINFACHTPYAPYFFVGHVEAHAAVGQPHISHGPFFVAMKVAEALEGAGINAVALAQ